MILEKIDGREDWENDKTCTTPCCNKPYVQTMTFWPSPKMNGVFPEETMDLAMMYFKS